MNGRHRIAVLGLGGVLTVLGATLVTRPFASLGVLVVLVIGSLVVLGVSELASHPRPWHLGTVVAAVAWFLGAAVIAVRPGLGIHALAVVVGVVLVIEGAARVYGAVRGTRDQRVASCLLGSAGVVLGLLALAWPDVTVLVVAVLFGVRVLWFGLTLLWAAARGHVGSPDHGEAAPGMLRRVTTVVASGLALLLALALAGVSAWLHASEPTVDAFYTAPAHLPSTPGRLLRAEVFTRGVPAGSQAWRILYTTTRDVGQPAVASALVVVKKNRPASPRPVIAWAHGTTGIASRCAPSVLKEPFTSGAMPAFEKVLSNGWAVVATDYVGLGTQGPHPYLIGQGEARSVLDAVRAAHQLAGLSLQNRTVVWGHSQGGGAALWAGILAPTYAPDTHVIGVAALSPASDLSGMASNLGKIPGGALFASYIITAYSQIYPDVKFDDYIRPAAQVPLRKMAERCLAEPQTILSIAQSLAFDKPFFAKDPTTGPLGQRLAQNIPSGVIPAPLFIGQGEVDPLVLPAVQAAYVARRCAMHGNGSLDYKTYPGREHVDVIANDSPLVPDLLAWTRARLAGKPAPSTCPQH